MTVRSRAALPQPYDGMYAAYATALSGARLAESSKSRYLNRVRAFLTWTAEASARGALGRDPLGDMAAAVGAAHRYQRHLRDGGYAPATIDGMLAAVDDFYARRGIGATGARRERS
ncbi:hypothetical protein OUY22_15380 [Nonomuraea sp. MCN248]|uniref:Core-binding (CB) domain-containing protein n=1 Tax=Nonomuraea corallina TaxID=2989783 RepID=A0ABT4SCW8_9ACTN|nr:hypothetical protein [Nonomuraea corallina]MDA0634805.1 hypothetical protein [Nonomuraea corallina]